MHLSADQSIGIFDSGIGGLTVASAISKALPEEHLIYYGDTMHLPYGDKSADAIRYYSLRISKFLLEQDCKMIVIACNSASAAAYDVLLEFFEGKVHFVNVVDPLVDAVVNTQIDKVGVIATKATIGSEVYLRKINDRAPKLQVSQLATPLLVPMIEEGFCEGKISRSIIDNYLSQDELVDIEALLLACTHYPLIKSEIQEYYDRNVIVLDSTDVATESVRQTLATQGLLRKRPKEKADIFYISDYTKSFDETSSLFYGKDVDLQVKSIW